MAVVLSASPDAVWAELSNIASHAEWMHDAESISFVSSQRTGVGTTFDCVTKVGPIRLTDRMEVTQWDEGRLMAIAHQGIVSGAGEFRLSPVTAAGHTELTWTETLRFGWRLGGPPAAALARPILRRIWSRNLKALAARF